MDRAQAEPSASELHEIREVLRPLPRNRDQLLPALVELQEALGWLPEWSLALIGTHLRVPRSEVYGVASSYPNLRLAPPAARTARVCTGPACRAQAPRLAGEISARLGVPIGASTPDGRLGLEETPCLFLCGVAPVVQVESACLGRATAAAAARALEEG